MYIWISPPTCFLSVQCKDNLFTPQLHHFLYQKWNAPDFLLSSYLFLICTLERRAPRSSPRHLLGPNASTLINGCGRICNLQGCRDLNRIAPTNANNRWNLRRAGTDLTGSEICCDSAHSKTIYFGIGFGRGSRSS